MTRKQNLGKHLRRYRIPAEVIEQCWQGDQEHYLLSELREVFGMSNATMYNWARRCGWLRPEFLETAPGYNYMQEEEFLDWWKINRGGLHNYKRLAEEIGFKHSSLLTRLRRYGVDTSWAPKRGRQKQMLW